MDRNSPANAPSHCLSSRSLSASCESVETSFLFPVLPTYKNKGRRVVEHTRESMTGSNVKSCEEHRSLPGESSAVGRVSAVGRSN